MEKVKQEEQKIFSQFESRINNIKGWKTKHLKEKIVSGVRKAKYCAEDWQCHYSAEAIWEAPILSKGMEKF